MEPFGWMILYTIMGLATLTLAVVLDDSDGGEIGGIIAFIIVFWPVVLAIMLGLWIRPKEDNDD